MDNNIHDVASKIIDIINEKYAIKDTSLSIEDIRLLGDNTNQIYITKKFKDIKAIDLKRYNHTKNIFHEDFFAIDGSNKTILYTNEIAIVFCRVVATNIKKKYVSEYIALSYLNNEREYKLHHYHLKGERLFNDGEVGKYDAYNPLYTFKGIRANPIEIATLLRKLGEWKIINTILSKEDAIIIKDGGLHTTIPEEAKLIEEAIKKHKKGIIGVVKNNLLVTTTGRNLIYDVSKYIEQYYNYKEWIFGKIAESNNNTHPAKIYVARYFHNAKPYRIDIPYTISDEKAEELILMLSNYAKDVDFLGYPYMLVKADRESSIKDYEIQTYKEEIMKTSKTLKEIALLAEDTHKMLWKI